MDITLVEGKGAKKRGGGKDGRYWHVYYQDKRAGMVFINPLEVDGLLCGTITVELNKLNRGKGMGEACFRQACELSPYNVVYATTRKSNIAAQIVAVRAGFVRMENVKGAQTKLVWHRPCIKQVSNYSS